MYRLYVTIVAILSQCEQDTWSTATSSIVSYLVHDPCLEDFLVYSTIMPHLLSGNDADPMTLCKWKLVFTSVHAGSSASTLISTEFSGPQSGMPPERVSRAHLCDLGQLNPIS